MRSRICRILQPILIRIAEDCDRNTVTFQQQLLKSTLKTDSALLGIPP